MNILFLGSSSQSRQRLLNEIQLPYQVIGHNANEDLVPHGPTLQDTVLAIARYKMDHIIMPDSVENDVRYIITADTMGSDSVGVIHGKPKNKIDAISKIKACRNGILVTATGFCIEKRIFKNNKWVIEGSFSDVVTSESIFIVPDNWIERYLDYSCGLVASGAVAIELYGGQFLKSINGSYSSIIGLPLYEVRKALEDLGFFD